MALTESELRVLAILGLVILILWSLFGLFWSLLLVFTFLIYAYNFGRHQAGNKLTRRDPEEEDSEHDLSYQEKLQKTYQEPLDLPFTGLPRENISLRSPMPLLSEVTTVTKRLSFNTSTTTPFQGRNSWHNRDLVPTPYPSRGSAFTYRRKPKHFSLLNPALQRPSTVKIASPDVTVNRTFTLSNSPLKKATDDWNPCSRVTVLSALKESRKRSLVVEEEEDELMRPTKRRDTKPVDSHPFSSPLFASRKRVAIPECTKTTPDEYFNKKSKITSHSDSSEILHSQTSAQKDSVVPKRKNRDSGTEITNREANLKNTEMGEDESSNKKSKFIDQIDSSETVHSQRQTDPVVQKRKDRAAETEKSNISQQADAKEESERNQSKKVKSLVQETKDDEDQRGRSEQAKRDNSSSPKQTKRFTVPRFASKEDSRRRAVPVYCASNEESEMPQRRTVSRKINQEQIKIDRRLAWERVKELLGGDEDDEEEEEEATRVSKSGDVPLNLPSGTTAVSSTAAGTSTSSSSLKIPTAGAVTSAGTITTTTTQSLIAPALSTGVPQRTTGVQGGPVTNAPVLQSQGTAVPSLQSQQASGPGLLINLLSNPGLSKNTSSAAGSQTASSEQVQSAVTAQASGVVNLSKAPTLGLQTNASLTATQGSAGLQLLSSTSSFGNSPFTTTNQLTSSATSSHKNTSDTNSSSAQQPGFSFPAIPSSGSSGTASKAVGPGGFTFAAASGAPNAVSLGQNSTQNTPGTSLFNSPSTSALGAASSQKPVTLAGNSAIAPPQNLFSSFAKPTQNSSVSSALPAPSAFSGQSSNAAPSSFGSAGQNKLTFGATNMQSIQQSQSPFGGTPSNTSGFGATSAQNTFGATVSKSSMQSPFSQGTVGARTNQNTSQGPAQKAFGTQHQNQQVTASAFGKPSGKSAFVNVTNTQGNFTFGSQVQQSTTQNVFGSQTTQNAFGPQANQNATQGAFGNRPAQNAFGAQATQSAFGTSSTQNTSSPFTFAANTAQNPSNSPFGGFSKAGTQSTFGAAPAQNAAAPSGGFNFSATGSSPAPGGFNFAASANKPSGFQFGAAGSSGNFGQFGQATAQPGAAPATPAPSGGFNFAAGSSGMPGSPFASPAAAPAFGVPSTPQGAGVNMTARSRARIAARRRGKK